MLNPLYLGGVLATVNPFDLKSALMARHAQHVVLVHFPIALFIVGVAFDLAAVWKNRRTFSDAAYFNLSVAAIFTIPVVATGILAWQFALEGQTLKGTLRLHLIFALLSTALIWTSWMLHFLERRKDAVAIPASLRIALELVGVMLISVTGHLGGFLSGVNGGT